MDEISIIPKWLTERKEMVYPQSGIERHQELGSGQYGMVFKGRLKQGNAVYVYLWLY